MGCCFKSLMLATVMAFMVPGLLAQSTLDVGVSQTASTTCASGEPVALNGDLHFTYSFTTDVTTLINTYQVQIVSQVNGVGQTTQANYAGNSSFSYSVPTTDSPAQFTAQLSYGLKPQGTGASLILNHTVNITVDNVGNISASVPSSSTTCAGT